MENYLTNSLRILVQPKQNFHFRYTSELQNTHGFITGQVPATPTTPQNYSAAETYPTIHLKLPADGNFDDSGKKREFYVLCSLHAYNMDERDHHWLSVHLLMPKSRRNVSYDFVFEKMSDDCNDATARCWELKDYVIVRLKSEEFEKSWKGKQQQYAALGLPLTFDQLKGDGLDLRDKECVKKSARLNVCLGFTIFESIDDGNTYRLYKETIYSDNIYHADDLRIHRLCNIDGSVRSGGKKVTLLIKLQSGYSYEVHMFRDEQGIAVWDVYIPVGQRNIFCNSSITFNLPDYTGPDFDGDSINVFIEVTVNRSTFKSQCVTFTYLKEEDDGSRNIDGVRRKRPRLVDEVQSEYNGPSMMLEPPVELMASSNAGYYLRSESASSVDDLPSGSGSYHTSQAQVTEVMPLEQNMTQLDGLFGPPLCFLQIPNRSPSPLTNLNDNFERMYNEVVYDPDESVNELLQSIVQSLERSEENESSTNDYPNISRDKIKTDETMSEISKHDNNNEKKSKISEEKIMKRLIEVVLRNPPADIRFPLNNLSKKFGNTIFHDAIMNESTLLNLRHLRRTTSHSDLILKARNKFQHNLLHYACFHNKSDCIKPLIGMGLALHEQDCNGRTPLHLAIDYHYRECISKIQEVLENHTAYDATVESSLSRMLTTYNRQGYTVLHLAVLEQMDELFEAMLKFCSAHNIDTTHFEVLGSGDSLAHLVVKTNSTSILQLLKKYVPNYLNIKNYAGYTMADIDDISEQMRASLYF
ncbi:nuclear factor NF-kappa-B p110 subunit-like [Musca vetustissima]|uniref:nuclear factor NF-kappa-B p110 subunit-like n=1 Tax=Musca vetustissima TaxID=27455 RepID=UPI002AB7460D|nr:nuclear factor NF-kappa-B p110 subunit-like [Musca vetustissima]